MQRPTGITILAVLALIGGVLGLFAALGLFGLGALSSAALGGVVVPRPTSPEETNWLPVNVLPPLRRATLALSSASGTAPLVRILSRIMLR